MQITKDTKLIEILDAYPWAAEMAKQYDSRAAMIDTPIGKALAKKYTVEDVSKMVGMNVDDLIAEAYKYIEEYENQNKQ